MSQTPATFAEAREQFLQLVNDVRPELHRYCARLTGSVIEGEDIVQAVPVRAVEAGERFQPVERAGLLESFGVQFQRGVGGVAAGAAAGSFFGHLRVRRRIGAEEEFRAAGNGRGDQRLAVRLALEDRQAVPVRTDAAQENGVAVVEQMMGGNGGCHGRRRIGDEFRRVPGRDVFHDHL